MLKEALPKLENYLIIHPVGPQDYSTIKKLSQKYSNYLVFDYIGLEDIGWVLNNANIIIGRSGANTSQEIVALKKKSILIPLPFSQQNEQAKNARWVKRQLPEHTIIIDQNNLDQKTLLTSIGKLIKKPSLKQDKINYGNQKLLSLIHNLI
jgi:UDP-N-acetylglucosamine:LPS N-acetylglucosamine transferase